MTAIASTDVTVTVSPRDKNMLAMGGGSKIISLANIAFGDGSLTYETGGIALPAKSRFGMVRLLQRVFIQQPDGNGFVYRYDPDNHKMKIFTQGFTTGSTAAASNENGALAEDSVASEGTPRLPNTVADTTYDMGGLIELPNGTAIAAVTLPVMVVGE